MLTYRAVVRTEVENQKDKHFMPLEMAAVLLGTQTSKSNAENRTSGLGSKTPKEKEPSAKVHPSQTTTIC